MLLSLHEFNDTSTLWPCHQALTCKCLAVPGLLKNGHVQSWQLNHSRIPSSTSTTMDAQKLAYVATVVRQYGVSKFDAVLLSGV
jgi:hypothetical protein